MLITRIQELRDQATREELFDSIKQMKAAIREYEEHYDALSPEELVRQLPLKLVRNGKTSQSGRQRVRTLRSRRQHSPTMKPVNNSRHEGD